MGVVVAHFLLTYPHTLYIYHRYLILYLVINRWLIRCQYDPLQKADRITSENQNLFLHGTFLNYANNCCINFV